MAKNPEDEPEVLQAPPQLEDTPNLELHPAANREYDEG